MIHINLLPYRQIRRKIQVRRDLIGGGIFLVLVVLLVGIGYHRLQQVEQDYRAGVEYMQSELAKLRKRLGKVKEIEEKRAVLRKKLELIQRLQQNRGQAVRILQTVGRAVPKTVSLKRMEQVPGGLHFEGRARSNQAISNFMRDLGATQLLDDPELAIITIERAGDQELKAFRMQASMEGSKVKGKKGQ